MKLNAIELYASTIECIKCQGKCCKRLPGIFHPDQFKSEKEILKLLETGNYSIDCWEGEERKYYLRPATINGRDKIIDYSWGGQCIFLSSKGCDLLDKPIECKALKPNIKECAAMTDSKYNLGTEWDNSKFDLYTLANLL